MIISSLLNNVIKPTKVGFFMPVLQSVLRTHQNTIFKLIVFFIINIEYSLITESVAMLDTHITKH